VGTRRVPRRAVRVDGHAALTRDALPDHDPEALARAVLAAFGEANDPLGPASALFGVASGRLAASLGSPEHLADVLHNPVWSTLVGHAARTFEPFERLDDAVRVQVNVTAREGGEATPYLLSMRAVQVDGAKRWRVTGLVPAHRLDV